MWVSYYISHEGIIWVGFCHQQLKRSEDRRDVEGRPPRTLHENIYGKFLNQKLPSPLHPEGKIPWTHCLPCKIK